MARYSAGALSTAGSTTLPIGALVGGTTVRPKLAEVGVFNTSATAVALKLVRLTSAGTPGAGLVEAPHVPEARAAVATAFNTYTGTAPTLGADLGYRAVLGGSVGAGIIWTFPQGIYIPATAAAGIGILVENGTGQACQYWFCWDEEE